MGFVTEADLQGAATNEPGVYVRVHRVVHIEHSSACRTPLLSPRRDAQGALGVNFFCCCLFAAEKKKGEGQREEKMKKCH